MTQELGAKRGYHHGNLAASLLAAVDELASRFGLEAVTLRGCAKLAGVSPSSAFRHYADKRALITAFAARALAELSEVMASAAARAQQEGTDAFQAVGLAYVAFALDKPAFFRAMWYHEGIYANDPTYVAAATRLGDQLCAGFADTLPDENRATLNARELLSWSSVHGLASLLVDGPVARDLPRCEKLQMAADMLQALRPALRE